MGNFESFDLDGAFLQVSPPSGYILRGTPAKPNGVRPSLSSPLPTAVKKKAV